MEENKGPSQTKDDTDRMLVELEFSKAQVLSLEQKLKEEMLINLKLKKEVKKLE